jgi:hypothetical protein
MTIALMIVGVSLQAAAQEHSFWKKLGLGSKTALTESKIGSGLKEALVVGINKTVERTGVTDGYFCNEVIKILMPEKLVKVEKGLRKVGFGPKVDEFILSMNRAAEKAAPLAKDIFVQAIVDMNFEDAKKILKGGDTAATDYLQAKTSDRLTEAFRPVMENAMNEYDVTRQYQRVISHYQAIPFVKKADPIQIEEYVVGKALDGLFYTLAEQERLIRTDPKARVTDLLQEVFGGEGESKPASGEGSSSGPKWNLFRRKPEP